MKYLLLIIFFLQSCATENSIIITEFSTYSKPIDSLFSDEGPRLFYNNFFLVSNYRDSKIVELKIDNFITSHILKNNYSEDTEEIRLYFYKESKKTNLIEIKKNPRVIDRYSNQNDLVYYYSIKPNGEKIREKYKKGKIVEATGQNNPNPDFIIDSFELIPKK